MSRSLDGLWPLQTDYGPTVYLWFKLNIISMRLVLSQSIKPQAHYLIGHNSVYNIMIQSCLVSWLLHPWVRGCLIMMR